MNVFPISLHLCPALGQRTRQRSIPFFLRFSNHRLPLHWAELGRSLLLGGLSISLAPLPGFARASLVSEDSTHHRSPGIVQHSTLPPHLTSTADRIVQQINQIRVNQGLQPVQNNPKLSQVAQSYSQLMGQTGCFGHDCADGASLKQRVAAVGIRTNWVSENLFKGPEGGGVGDRAISAWVNDLAHRCNLLLPEATETGIGVWQQGQTVYATQIFAQPRLGPNEHLPSFRQQFESQVKQANPNLAVQLFETLQTREFGQQLQIPLCGMTSAAEQTARILEALSGFTAQRAAVIYVISLNDQLQLLMVPPESQRSAFWMPTRFASSSLERPTPASNPQSPVIRQIMGNVSRDRLLSVSTSFRQAVSDPSRVNSQSYLTSAQQLYQWLVAPLEPELRERQVDTLLFAMDDDLRSIPIAALHDGQQFLVEKYAVSLIPSFGLTQVRVTDLKTLPLLAMGISESTEGQSALPAVSTELSLLENHLWRGQTQITLNQTSTLTNLKTKHRQFQPGILHLATHAEFRPGQIQNSFIQFWNDKLTLDQLQPLSQQLQWGDDPSVQLLVLSACQTALGSKEAELGFAGSAIAAGVPATIASLWSISDDGTLGMMAKFYQHLRVTSSKAEALRQSQLSMLRGELSIQHGKLSLSQTDQVPLPSILAEGGDRKFIHPYFWSGYTVVGNWN